MTRSFELPGQQKVHFVKHPRYGTWSVNFDKGGIPMSLSGQYQSFGDLYDKVNYYLSIREKNQCTIGPEITNA